MTDKLMLGLIRLVDEINNNIEYDQDWEINVGVILEYYTESVSLNWMGHQLWDYNADGETDIVEIEQDVRKELQRVKNIIKGL